MKNIGLIFDSSHKIGGGHFWRCFNLAKLLKNKNIMPENPITIPNDL